MTFANALNIGSPGIIYLDTSTSKPLFDSVTLTANGVLVTDGSDVPSISQTLPSAVQGNITSLGTITSGTWHGSIISGTFGGTGINNGTNTITLGGNLTTSGAFNSTFTMTGTTSVTFPTSGTLATTSQLPTQGIVTLAGTSGSATGTTVTLTGSTSGAVFTGSGSTMTESFNYLALPSTDNSGNGVITINSIVQLNAIGTGNIFLGNGSGNTTTTATFNTGVGYQSLAGVTSGGGGNVGVGYQALKNITTGTNNTGIGVNAGTSLTTSDNSNIMIANLGVSGDSNTIRIGTHGGGGAQQSKCFIAGVNGVTSSNPLFVTINSSTNQLGTVTTGPQLSSSGAVTNSAQPMFVAYLANALTNVTGDGTDYKVVFDTVVTDTASAYSGGTYTTPVAGNYLICSSLMFSNVNVTQTTAVVYLLNGVVNFGSQFNPFAALSSGGFASYSISGIVHLNAGVGIETHGIVYNSTKTVGLQSGNANCYMSICLLS